jgi:DNA-binding GntR family transcriptional regulator
VRIPTRDDVKGHYLVREILEAEAARRFAEHATASERAGLLRMAAKVDALSTKKDRGPYLSLHHRLHSRIAECARCAALSSVIEQTCALSSTWFCLLPRSVAPSETHRHRELANKLITSTPDEAASVMREHVRFSEREALERLTPYFRIKKAHGRTFFRSERAQARQLRRNVAERARD